MNNAIFISFGCLVASLLAGIVGAQISRAAGWKHQTSFAWVALTGALYAGLNLPSVLPDVSDAGVVLGTRLQLAVAALHALAWIHFASQTLGEPRRRLCAVLRVGLGLAAVAFMFPGLALSERVHLHEVPALGVRYRLVDPTPVGSLLLALVVATFGVLGRRQFRAWRAGNRHARLLAAAFGLFFLLTANDAAAVAGLFSTPFLSELGLLALIGVVAWSSGTRFTEDARELAALRVRLEELVEARTRDLHGATDRLRRVEKLATLGQVSAGVAHEVNNPAAVLAGNLEYLDAALRKGALPEDALECIGEAKAAVRRISAIVRQLHHAGRAAGRPADRTLVQVAPIARSAARAAREAADHVRVDVEVPEWLLAVGEEELLHQVLVNVLVNGVHAIPPERADGRVVVTAGFEPDRVRIEVRDNGAGMSEEVMRNAFEPFFTTKAAGKGSGLGLAISRGLMTSLGGDLHLVSAVGVGTRAVIELPGEAALTGGRPFRRENATGRLN